MTSRLVQAFKYLCCTHRKLFMEFRFFALLFRFEGKSHHPLSRSHWHFLTCLDVDLFPSFYAVGKDKEQQHIRSFVTFMLMVANLWLASIPYTHLWCTMPIFNSCTTCMCSPGIINDRTHGCHPVSWARMTTKLINIALICKLHGSLVCLANFWRVRCPVDWFRN